MRPYFTTPIYYVNSVPHVGHALTMLACDVCKRYARMHGQDAVMLTGTDENGLKVFEAAQESGQDPIAFVDRISQAFRHCADSIGIEYDFFYRTTSEQHRVAVHRVFELLRERNYVYTDTYSGWYDVSAETFVKESEVVDGKSPDGNPVRWVEEENWFFRLSAFGEQLLRKIEAEPNWILPPTRRNEVVSFIKQGLRDVCISRTNPGWGIPVPGDESRVIYVWFDALINYLAATGWPEGDWQELWPAEAHWMAKEILTRFHATLWPAVLMAIDLPLPKTIVAHGWFVFGDSKMSKSRGNVISPDELVAFFRDRAGCAPDIAADVVRFSLARSLPYEGDTNFSWEEVGRIYNADLANDLGNALNRSLSMAHKFTGGSMPESDPEELAEQAIRKAISDAEAAMQLYKLDEFTEAGINLVRWLNKYIDERAPWALAKNNDPALGQVISSMLSTLAAAAGILTPVIPRAAAEIFRQLGTAPLTEWSGISAPRILAPGTPLGQPEPIFPRLDKDLMDQLKPPAPESPTPAPKAQVTSEAPAVIEFADFAKVQLRIGRVVEAEAVPESNKLMKLQVQIGEETRQILAGIKKKYSAEDLIGRQVVVVANLKPAKLMGLESQGMLLAADDVDGQAILLQPDSEAPEGAAVH